jgi:hypothetical protein
MLEYYKERVIKFIEVTEKNNLEMILVGSCKESG